MKDVAKAAGVSVMTVSRAFKDHASVKPGTREQIRQVAADMGYVFDSTAANLRTQRSNFVAVIIPSINNANFADTISGLSGPIEASGRQILLGNSNYDIDREERLVEQLLQRRPEALVLTGGRHTDRVRHRLADVGMPIIEMWDLPERPIGHVVGFDNAAAMDILVRHLTDRGRQRIGFIGGDAPQDARGAHRRQGFVAAMQKRSLSGHRLIDTGTPPISMREGAVAMGQLLDDLPDTDAVICVSDLTAFGALTECIRRGVAVPDEMAIAGFGAYEIASVSVPTLTTVNPHPQDIGRRAGELIVSLLDGSYTDNGGENTRTILEITTEISPGGSTP
ncbi:LacI family DNA-binding transcriptional regulator [Cucumibacter marinus]|uniref:LacI family DNA-binding transcriptional regulator n=1 Tax=Cucumibacter marinus TaxID=1121252 RepID=UPI0004242045|nr:LacI family DNA-binding transcriptional regulator [Cucumibacter marinus]